jgi:hypothetical protein
MVGSIVIRVLHSMLEYTRIFSKIGAASPFSHRWIIVCKHHQGTPRGGHDPSPHTHTHTHTLGLTLNEQKNNDCEENIVVLGVEPAD